MGQDQQTCAELLGIPVGLLACHVLSSRLLETVTLGQVNNQYFLQSVVGEGQPALECEYDGRTYQVSLESPHQVKICNFDRGWEQGGPPGSGQLENSLATILTPLGKKSWFSFGKGASLKPTVIPTQTVKVTSLDDEISLHVDGYRTIKTPAIINVAKERLKLIVGKKRLF
jgi:hypothetical protein